MKPIRNKLAVCFLSLLAVAVVQAQVNVQNTGILYVANSADILSVNGSFTNAATGVLTNNGGLYVSQSLVNDQPAMAVGTGTLYLVGISPQTLSGSQLFRTYNLVSNNSTGITLNNDLSVTGMHNFAAGIISTSATPNYLMYEAGASYSGDADANHVKGWVRKTGNTAFSFPVGNGTVERPIGISSLSASSVFNALYAGPTTNPNNIAAPLVTVDKNEYWIVNKASGGNAIVNMNWNNSKIPMPNYLLSSIRVANYISGNWTQVGGSATGNTATTGAISSNTLAAFGSFTFGSITFILPVSILQFIAVNDNGYAKVSWVTNDEINLSHYDVQRSNDGLQFYSIGKVGAHNQAGTQQYKFNDPVVPNDLTYYRLLSVDADGTGKYSKVVTLRSGSVKYFSIGNPAVNSIHVTAKNISGDFDYRLSTIAGQVVQQGPLKLSAGSTDILLSPAVTRGMYVLQIQRDGFNFGQKLLISR